MTRTDLPLSNLEGICIEVSWYRPPDALVEIFRQLEECLQVLDKENRDIILVGDTNCDFLPIVSGAEDTCTPEKLPLHSKNLLDIYDRFGLKQLIKRRTRETLKTATLIDIIATTNKAFIVESGVYETTISDHYLVYCVKRFRDTAKKQHKNISTRQMKNFNEENILSDLQRIDWKSIVSITDDINFIVEKWTNMFSLILEKHAPLRFRRASEKFCPWLTKDFKCLSATRDRLKLAAVRSKSKIFMDAYKQTRNRVNRLNTDLKRDYFTNMIALPKVILKTLRKPLTWFSIRNKKRLKSSHLMLMVSMLPIITLLLRQ